MKRHYSYAITSYETQERENLIIVYFVLWQPQEKFKCPLGKNACQEVTISIVTRVSKIFCDVGQYLEVPAKSPENVDIMFSYTRDSLS